MKTNVIRKMILDTFEGAPYQIYVRADGIESEKHGNIHFLSAMREDLLARTAVCIHDGNDYICEVCACAAVPQLIISDHSYGRTANALAARRYGFARKRSVTRSSALAILKIFTDSLIPLCVHGKKRLSDQRKVF